MVRAFAAHAQPAQVGVAKLGLAAGSRLGIAFGAPALSRAGVVVDLVVDLVILKGGPQGSGDGARDAEALVAVVEDVQESQRGVFINGRARRRVNEVPGGADVGVGDVEGFVEGL